MRLERVLLNLLRLGATIQVVVGIALWSGHWFEYVTVHMAVGVLFVLLLWTLAVTVLLRRVNARLAIVTIVWGLVIAAFGVTQQRLLAGDLHWIIRALHLIVGVAAMPVAERLAKTPPVAAP
jgi:hypothetical protein